MKIRRLTSLLLLSILVLSGCQLAQEEIAVKKEEDYLIGVLITKEYLDLFDFESYLTDHLGEAVKGDMVVDKKEEEYEGRLYAVLKEGEGGKKGSANLEYVFEDVEGFSFFAATIPAKDEQESYVTISSNESINDLHTGTSYGDEVDELTLKGTIYVSALQFGTCFYANPVYQTADGRVYAKTGDGFRIMDQTSEAEIVENSYGVSLKEESKFTKNEKSKTRITSIDLSYLTVFPPEKIVLLQMDKESSVILRETYKPGEVPKEFIPKKETEYIIVETYKKDATGQLIPNREIVTKKDEILSTLYCGEDGICVKELTQLLWKEWRKGER